MDSNRRTSYNTKRGRDEIKHTAVTTNSNAIYRKRPFPQAEFHPQPNKISKTSARNFSDAGSKRTFTDMKPRAQGKGKAVDARSNLSCMSFDEPVRPKSREIDRFIGKPPRPEVEPRTNKIYNTSTSAPAASLPPPPLVNEKKHSLPPPPPPPVNEKKPVNWRLACFMANEYVTRGTLLGRPWPPPSPQDSNTERPENKNKSKATSASVEEESPESRKEKVRMYYTLADIFSSGDVHIPGIFNPSQLAAWLGLKL